MMVYDEGDTGVDVSRKDQVSYNTWFAGVVHDAGMFVGLKNAVEMVEDVVFSFDYAINEECHQWNECDVSFHHFSIAAKYPRAAAVVARANLMFVPHYIRCDNRSLAVFEKS